MSLEVNISEPDEFNCIELHSSIKEVAKIKGIENFEYNVDCLNGKGINYIANVFRVMIRNTEDNEESFSVIVKTLVNTERHVLFHELHKREVIAYNNVISKFNAIQRAVDDELKIVLPECLYSNTKINNEIIIFNDLNSQGYQIDGKIAKFEFLSIEQINSVMNELGKFHALSFIFESKEAESFNEMKSDFHDIIFQNSFLNKSKLKDYFFESFEMSLKLVSDREAKKKLRKIKENLLELLQMFTNPGKFNVLCHGDCWVNNILFKDEENSKSKICFIDYQAMRYANPVTDLMYFLYICTDSNIRSDNIDLYKNTYYESLKTFLELFDMNIDGIYSKEDFDLDWEEYKLFGLIIAMVELRIVTMTPEDDVTLKGSKLTSNWDLSQVPEESDLFRYRVNDLIKESIENGVLEKLVEKVNIIINNL